MALLLAADGGDDVQALHTGKRVFQHFADLRLHHSAGRSNVTGFHRDGGVVNLGVLANNQSVERHHADQHNQQGQDGGEYRPADRQLWQLHISS